MDPFFRRQKERLRGRLRYYERVRDSKHRTPEYWSHKHLNVIPNIVQAIARIDSGEYGLCISCGAEIDRARLEKVPAALRCLSCQEKQERKKKYAPGA